MKAILVIIISYLIGSFSLSYLLGKRKNIDIREHGSGNAGATNTLRVLGKKSALMTFISDFLKGIIAVYIGKTIYGDMGGFIAGLAVVLGHNYSLFLRFKGGKGVATSLAVLYALSWKAGIVSTIIGILVIAFSKYVSLGSILAAASAPLILNLVDKPDKYTNLTILILAFLIVIRHRSNIKRLKDGNENKLKI